MTETLSHCNLCGASLDTAELVYVFNDFPIVRCMTCGLVLTNPRPGRDEISRYYGDGYYAYLPPDRRNFKEKLKDGVLGELGGYPAEGGLLARPLMKTAAMLLRPHIMVVAPYMPGGILLDAGCGAGSFLRWALRAGWNTVGLEVDPRGADEARRHGLPVITGSMEDCSLDDDSFDVVVFNHTLEHCHDPNRVLEHGRRILKPGGLLIVGVPNFDGYDNRVFGDSWSNCDAPRHLYHFTPRTLTAMLGRHGFVLEKVRYKKWLIPHSERISFRFLKRKLAKDPWHRRTALMLRTRFRIQIIKKVLQLLHLRPDAELAQMMTAYAHKRKTTS